MEAPTILCDGAIDIKKRIHLHRQTSSYRDRFTSTKKFISNIQMDKKFLEINDIKWVSLDTIKYSIENKKSFIKLRTVFEQNLLTSIDEIVRFID